jgi:hypothetical protein
MRSETTPIISTTKADAPQAGTWITGWKRKHASVPAFQRPKATFVSIRTPLKIRNETPAALNQLTPYTMPLLPPQDNFADLREVANKLLASTTDDNVKRLVQVVGMLLYRCDLLEREVERLERSDE